MKKHNKINMSVMDKIKQLPQSVDDFNPTMKLITNMTCSEIVAYLADETLPNEERTLEGQQENTKYLGDQNITSKVLENICQKYKNILRTRIVAYTELDTLENNLESSIQELMEQVDWNLFPELETIQQKEEYIGKHVYSILYLQYVYWCSYNCSYEYENFNDIDDYYRNFDEEYEREQDMKYMKKYCR